MIDNYKTCLLIEDDPEDQEFFISTLHSVSSRVGCYAVSNGEEALYALKAQEISPDYIFTDIQMPRMNGMEFIKKVKAIAEFSNIPVIVYSSTYCEEQALKAKNLGAIAFYSKARFRALAGILRQYFGDPGFQSVL